MKERRSYTKELKMSPAARYKANAVSLVLSGRRAMDVSRDLGIEVSNLNRWRKEYLDGLDQGHTGEGKSPSELAAENKLLRKELAEQREIVTILKKTIKYVS
jgi:transposase